MTEENYRLKRIERLLNELRYEVVRGMMEGGISEWLSFKFFVPTSKEVKNGMVKCEFKTEPFDARFLSSAEHHEFPKLRLIRGGKT